VGDVTYGLWQCELYEEEEDQIQLTACMVVSTLTVPKVVFRLND